MGWGTSWASDRNAAGEATRGDDEGAIVKNIIEKIKLYINVIMNLP